MNYEDLSVDVTDGVAVITLDRPETRNVISNEPLMSELIDVCEQVGGDAAVRVAILTGAGPAFSAGGNVKEMHDRSGMFAGPVFSVASRYRTGIQRAIKAVYDLPVPTIAAVNGPAIGAGFDLTLACDMRLAAATAKFGETFLGLGIISGDGGSWLLPRIVGPQRAAELTYTARVFDADEALALGIVLSTHDGADLLAAARDLAATIASRPAPAIRSAKSLIRRGSASTFADALEAAADMQAILHDTDEHRTALDHFMAARKERRNDS